MNNLLKPMITIIITFNGETTEMKVERQKYQQTIEALKLNYPNATIKTIDHYDLLSQIAEDFKINSHKVGLVYLLLDKDYKILYVGSSSNTGDKRLMQSDRMRSELKPEIITANYVGWEYGERIQYAVKIITKSYKNIEAHLIYLLQPEFNTKCTKEYSSNWINPASETLQMSICSTEWLNSIYDNGFYNPIFNEGNIYPISKFMNAKNSNSSNSHGIKKGDTHE